MSDEATGGNGTGNGTHAYPNLRSWPKGVSGNPGGSSNLQRFKNAIMREAKKRAREGDADELDQFARRFHDLLEENDTAATRLLLEMWAREDGPIPTEITGKDGGPISMQKHVIIHTDPKDTELLIEDEDGLIVIERPDGTRVPFDQEAESA